MKLDNIKAEEKCLNDYGQIKMGLEDIMWLSESPILKSHDIDDHLVN